MQTELILMDIDASIKRFCVDFGEASLPQLAYEEFDDHADESSVPKMDLIGTSALSAVTNHPFITINVMIGITTYSDTNILRLRELVAGLFQRLQPTNRIDLLDWKTGEKKGNLIVADGVRVLPVGGDDSRPIQYVAVEFKTDCFSN